MYGKSEKVMYKMTAIIHIIVAMNTILFCFLLGNSSPSFSGNINLSINSSKLIYKDVCGMLL